jgi:predicted choloylglycine hydrolase
MSNNPTIKYLKRISVRLAISAFYAFTKRHYKNIRIPEQYLDEIRGYSDATGIPYDYLFCINFGFDIVKRYGLHCSTISFFNKDSVIVGRNTDLTPNMTRMALKHAKSIIVDVSIPKKLRFTHVSVPLLVGAINGFNEDGIAVNSHQVIPTAEKPHEKRLATPLLMRMLLEDSNNLKKGEQIAKHNITARSLNVVLTSEKERKSIICEIHPSQIHFIHYAEKNITACCTTHFEGEEMHKLHTHPAKSSKMRLHASKTRLKSMRELVSRFKHMTPKNMIKILQDKSNGIEFRHGAKSLTNEGTYQSFVFDLTHNIMWVSNADKPPASLHGKFVEFKVNRGK